MGVARRVALGPTLAAFVVTAATEGREGVRWLLGRILLWQVGLRWYLFVLAGIPAIVLLSAVVVYLSPKTVRNYVSNIFTKLQVSDRPQAIVRVREAGLGNRG